MTHLLLKRSDAPANRAPAKSKGTDLKAGHYVMGEQRPTHSKPERQGHPEGSCKSNAPRAANLLLGRLSLQGIQPLRPIKKE
jgi:hypothetical protein